MTAVQFGSIFGATIGGAIHFKNQYMDFMESASASQYKWHLDAKAALSTKMVNGAIRGAFVWGTKSVMCSSTYGQVVDNLALNESLLTSQHNLGVYCHCRIDSWSA